MLSLKVDHTQQVYCTKQYKKFGKIKSRTRIQTQTKTQEKYERFYRYKVKEKKDALKDDDKTQLFKHTATHVPIRGDPIMKKKIENKNKATVTKDSAPDVMMDGTTTSMTKSISTPDPTIERARMSIRSGRSIERRFDSNVINFNMKVIASKCTYQGLSESLNRLSMTLKEKGIDI